MDAYCTGVECFNDLEGTPIAIEVFEGESIDGLFDPDKIALGVRMSCTPLGPGSYEGVSSVIFYASAGERHLCITVIDHNDGCQKKCKLEKVWRVDKDDGRLEIDEIKT